MENPYLRLVLMLPSPAEIESMELKYIFERFTNDIRVCSLCMIRVNRVKEHQAMLSPYELIGTLRYGNADVAKENRKLNDTSELYCA